MVQRAAQVFFLMAPLALANLFILCGIQGSGKSTLAKTLANEDTVLYEVDKFSSNKEFLYKNIRNDLLNGKSVIIDGTYATKIVRLKLLNYFVDIDCNKTVIVMTTPLNECLIRNSKRKGKARVSDTIIQTLYKNYETPTLEEGWDEIIYY